MAKSSPDLPREPSRDISELPTSPFDPAYDELTRKIDEDALGDGARLFQHACERDFWFFCRYALRTGREFICVEKGCRYHGHHMFDHPWVFDRCREQQENPDFNIDLWARFHLKTTIITVGYTLWELIHNPNLAIGIGSYKVDEIAEAFLKGIADECLTNEVLQKHWPQIFWQPGETPTVWKGNAINLKRDTNRRENTIFIFGLQSSATSKHFDRIVWDDLVTEDAVSSPEQIERTTARWRQTTALRAQDTRIRFVGTHWAENDTYVAVQQNPQYKLRHRDCYEADGITSVLHPGSDWLEGWKIDMGDRNFMAQMRNIPADVMDRRFQVEHIKYYNTDPTEEVRGKKLYYFVDPASGVRGGDYTAMFGVALGTDGKYYVVDMVRDRLDPVSTANKIFDRDKRWRALGVPVDTWFYESFGARRDVAYLEAEMELRGHRFRVEEVAEKTPKEVRIERLYPAFYSGKIYFPKNGIHDKTNGEFKNLVDVFIQDEYALWTPNRAIPHDDMLDALSFLFIPSVVLAMEWPVPELGELLGGTVDLNELYPHLAYRSERGANRRNEGSVNAWVA